MKISQHREMRPMIRPDNLRETSDLPKEDGPHRPTYPKPKTREESTHINKNKINSVAVSLDKPIIQTSLLFKNLRWTWTTFMPNQIKEESKQRPKIRLKRHPRKNMPQMKIDWLVNHYKVRTIWTEHKVTPINMLHQKSRPWKKQHLQFAKLIQVKTQN